MLLSGSGKLFTMKFHRDEEVSLSHQSPAISLIRPFYNYPPAKLYNDYIDLPPSYLAVRVAAFMKITLMSATELNWGP